MCLIKSVIKLQYSFIDKPMQNKRIYVLLYKPKQLLALELKIKDTLIFQVRHISAFLEINPNKLLYVNKVQSLRFPMISILIWH